MSVENKPSEEVIENDKKEDKSGGDDKSQRELERMKEVIKTLQKTASEYETFKKEQEKSKLSAEERLKQEQEEIRKAKVEADQRVKQLEKSLETQRLVNTLVAEHGLRNPDFGEALLKRFDPEKEDFEVFAKRVRTDPKNVGVFRSLDSEEDSEVRTERKAAPPGPATGGSRPIKVSSDEQADKDKAWARQRYPGDEEKQKKLIKSLERERAASSKR